MVDSRNGVLMTENDGEDIVDSRDGVAVAATGPVLIRRWTRGNRHHRGGLIPAQ